LDVLQVDELLGQTEIEVNGRTYDLSASVETELAALTERVLNFVNSTLRGKNIRTVILGGGGAAFVYPDLNENTQMNWVLSANPRRGNVEGTYRFLLQNELGRA
jgi:hypothetical protein